MKASSTAALQAGAPSVGWYQFWPLSAVSTVHTTTLISAPISSQQQPTLNTDKHTSTQLLFHMLLLVTYIVCLNANQLIRVIALSLIIIFFLIIFTCILFYEFHKISPWTLSGKCHSMQTSPRIFVCGVVLVFYLASYSITDKESKIFLIFIGVVGDECMLILSLARHIATTYINTGHSSALLLHYTRPVTSLLTPDTFIDILMSK